jgi:predicted  nucleic acid-binding Zn-ribbon protein
MSENAEPNDAELEREAARLRKRIKELETEIDILKRFTAYWVKGSP